MIKKIRYGRGLRLSVTVTVEIEYQQCQRQRAGNRDGSLNFPFDFHPPLLQIADLKFEPVALHQVFILGIGTGHLRAGFCQLGLVEIQK